MRHLGFALKSMRGLVGEKLSFSIKGINIYVLLCCCSKGKMIKKMTKIEIEHFH